MFWEFKLYFPASNYVRKASELCFDNVNSNCARRTAEGMTLRIMFDENELVPSQWENN